MIEEHKELFIENLISKQSKIAQNEIESTMQSLRTFCIENDLNVLSITTVTFAMEKDSTGNQILDLEILVNIENNYLPSSLPQGFVKKEKLLITNALFTHYEGLKQGMINSLNEIQTYIVQNKIQAITPAYSVSHNPFNQNTNNIDLDIYVGANPNVM